MPYPHSEFPSRVWDGLSFNIDRFSVNNNINPDAEDWERIASEVISLQENTGGVLLPTITEDGSLIIVDGLGNSYPLTVSAIALADATAGAITIDLPSASSFSGQHLTVKKIDATANSVTIDGDSSETIDGETTQEITDQYVSITIVSDGAGWFIL